MINVIIETDDGEKNINEIITAAAEAALLDQKRSGDIDVLVVDDATIHKMNLEYRKIDRPTDVLSFPAEEGEQIASLPDGFMGDIVISLDRAKAQAEEYGHSLVRELSFLTIHGLLHIMGYDHIEDNERAIMFARQEKILEDMRVTR